jgi:hypothetical protein
MNTDCENDAEMKAEFIIAQNDASESVPTGKADGKKEKTMYSYQLNVELAKAIDRDRQEKAEKLRLHRQVQAGRPRVLDSLGLHIGELVIALALALRLR